jgi:hypothetical protein
MGWKPRMWELITIFVLSAGGFESIYVTILFFIIIGTCRHASAASEGATSFAIIKDDMSCS